MTKSKTRKVIMAGVDKVNNSEIKLILTPDDDSFIPMFWVHNRKLSPFVELLFSQLCNLSLGF